MKTYRAAKYLRLSDADKDKYNNVSDSISNQSFTIDEYIKRHNDIELYDTYIDDGKTGMNYERDGFKRMMQDVDAKIINCIIVKDLSRIGREHCDTIHLLKKVFPLKGVRFISVVDNIEINEKIIPGIDIPIKVVVNDWYSENISMQVRNALTMKRNNGKFTGSFASYGYMKDPNDKNHLLIDEEAAMNVQRIFREFLQGNSIRTIAKSLNDEKVYSPSAYKKYCQGLTYRNYRSEIDKEHWTYSTIKAMLRKEVYIGNMVQHTSEKIAYNISKKRNIPKEEHVIVEKTHESIIDDATFEKVQKIIAAKKYRQRTATLGNENIYRGIFFCGDCGYAMSKIKYSSSERSHSFGFRCGNYARSGVGYCTSHSINKKVLDEILLEEIRSNIEAALQLVNTEEFLKLVKNNKKLSATSQLEKLKERKLSLLEEKKIMLLNLSKKIIAEEDYLLYNEGYIKELDLIDQKTTMLSKKEYEEKNDQLQYENWITNFLKYKGINEITRDILVSLVEKIIIYEDKTIEIKFWFENPFQ